MRRLLALAAVLLCLGGWSMAYNADLLRAITQASRATGVPANVLLATTLVESGGNPYGPGGDGGRSWGAFQEYDLGRGKGLTRAQRQDPYGSAMRAAREFAVYMKKGYTGGALAAAAQRPAAPGSYAAKVNALLKSGQVSSILGGQGVVPGAGPSPLAQSQLGAGGVTDGRRQLGLAAIANRQEGETFTQSVGKQLRTGQFNLGSRPLVDGPPQGMSSPQGSGAADTAVVAYAKKYLGTPYSWGGGSTSGPSEGFGRGKGTVGFDCSSLVQYAWAQMGVKLPRTTYGQIKAGRAVRHLSDLRPGDLLFPHTGHVQMYIGNGQVIHSPRTGDVVRVAPLGKRFVAIRRPGG